MTREVTWKKMGRGTLKIGIPMDGIWDIHMVYSRTYPAVWNVELLQALTALNVLVYSLVDALYSKREPVHHQMPDYCQIE